MTSVEPTKNSKINIALNDSQNSENIKGISNSLYQNQNPNFEEEKDEQNKSNSDEEVNVKTYNAKLVFLGDSSVGKTSIIRRYCENKFEEFSCMATVSAAYRNKKVKIDPFTEINMQIWDTAGQEKYRSMTRGYLRGANGIFIVFDLSSMKSFNSLMSWMEEIRDSDVDKNCVKILIGNKFDFLHKEVDEETINKYVEENNLKYLNVSAKDSINIEAMFEMMGNACAKVFQDEENNEDTINDKSKDKKVEYKNPNFSISSKKKQQQIEEKSGCCRFIFLVTLFNSHNYLIWVILCNYIF